MESPAEIVLPSPDFDALILDLAKLSRNHLLYFRIEVGRRLAAAFYGEDRDLYRATNRRKEGSFREFVAQKAEALEDLGLTESLLRQSMMAYFVVQDLPREVVAQLVYSHVVRLTTIEDDETRAVLAQAAVDNGWNGQDLQRAIQAVRAGRWPDADPEAPGLQTDGLPAPEPAGEGRVHLPPGRVVSRVEKTAREVEDLLAQWQGVAVERLSTEQTRRMRDALGALERQIKQMKARLRR